ncbi:MAG: NCS2 family permease [Oscillospiraceae bacterium]|jgi:AGZA family xanthine/uracil permease-like MFS transporter|nr:NCS2 family permease [Oscillospiraceae bacterium]
MEKFFKLKAYGTKPGTEILAGFTTFFTMAYIIFVNPAMLASTGMNQSGVFVATCVAAAIGTLLMALLANLPYAQAPGMGLNAFFTYTVCMGMGFVWQEALAMVFICSLIAIVLTVTKVRQSLLLAIPRSLQNAIGGAIGLFIAYIGIKNANIIDFSATAAGLTAGDTAVPELVKFNNGPVLLALFGLVLVIVLLVFKVKGALLIGIIASTAIGALLQGAFGVSMAMQLTDIKFDMSAVSSVKEVAFSFFGKPGLGSLFTDPNRVFLTIIAILAFTLTDIFDTIGTFIGTGRHSGIFTDKDEAALKTGSGFKTRIERGLFADMTATLCGSLLGTSNVTTYVESSAGIGVGGRTGLSSLVTGILLLLCVPLASVAGIVPASATAPALIIVGVLMMGSFAHIKWNDFEEAVPVFFTVIFMVFSYSISNGIAAGFIFYCIVKLCRGKVKEIHPILAGTAAVFLISFILQAIQSVT